MFIHTIACLLSFKLPLESTKVTLLPFFWPNLLNTGILKCPESETEMVENSMSKMARQLSVRNVSLYLTHKNPHLTVATHCGVFCGH